MVQNMSYYKELLNFINADSRLRGAKGIERTSSVQCSDDFIGGAVIITASGEMLNRGHCVQ